MNHFRVYGLTCVLMAVAASISATTIVMPTDAQLVAKSPLIIEGKVVSSVAVDRSGGIWTESVIEVERVLKGSAGKTVHVSEPGGEIDGRITKIFGAPAYRTGEQVLLFLAPTPRGDFQTVDLFVGKFSEATMMNGRQLWVRGEEASEAALLSADLKPIAPSNVQRDAAGFERFIAERVAGFDAVANYGVENPVLQNSLSIESTGRQAASDFTLLGAPTLYRWFVFDTGGAAEWRTSGSQPGYNGGGVSETQTAMAAWNGYSAARIRYTYGGTTSNVAGLARPNGVNEVLFNDPLGEIAGSWSSSTGGTVGRAGFNGVAAAQQWTSPFTADAQHPQGTFTVYNIVEGNMVIQDGVSASAGISSNRLAEIIAHEFGHTLGFDHSADGSALMYASVTGLGPSLRADDQLAARWLYPSGTTVPPPPPATVPAAPSNLAASVGGTNVSLQWTDNASNESGVAIYVAAGNGAFTRVADVAANSSSASLTGFSAGTYRIYVVAFNQAGNSSASNTVTVTIGAAVNAAFTVSPSTGVAGQTVFTFTDQSTGTVSGRSWQFGDGGSSTAQNPTRTYATPGQYTVSLTVTGGGTQSTTSRIINVVAPTAPLIASFSFAPSSLTTDTTITFTDTTTGGATAWQWVFGDGTSSSQQNPTKRYSLPGTYTVTLTAYRNTEGSGASRTVVVLSPAPALPAVSAAFDFSGGARIGVGVSFIDRSTGNPDRWSWNFGDGQISNAQNPVHVFSAPGNYTVTLTAGNAGSSSATSRVVSVSNSMVPFRSLVSASAQTSGAGGTFWRTELTLFNAGPEGVSLSAIFIPAAGGSPQSRTLFLAPLQSAAYSNALVELFGIGNGAGAIAIEATGATSSPVIKVSSRTFTTGSTGTYGQGVQDVTSRDLGQSLYLTGMISNDAYRTNLGLVNKSSFPVSVSMTLHSANGTTIGAANVTVPANQYQQASLGSYFVAVTQQPYDALSIRATTSAPDSVNVFASVIDNRSQDPIYIQGSALPAGALLIPAVGRAPGANGTFWRSDVTLFNPSPAASTVALRYAAAGTRTLTLAGGETRVLSDLISWFGLAGTSSGTLEISSFGTMPVVTSRSYTTDINGGTYGQSVDAVAAFGSEMFITGLRADASFRSNVGFVNGSNNSIEVTVRLIASNGQVVGNAHVTLGALGQTQTSLASLFPSVNVAGIGSVTLQATTDDGAPVLFAYGSIIDNASGDPVFFAGE